MAIIASDNPPSVETLTPSLKPEPSTWQHPLAFVSTETIRPMSEQDILTSITRELSKQWKEQGVTPSEFASDLKWVRRVYFGINWPGANNQ